MAHDLDIGRFEHKCHEAGLRVTHQRLEIYRALMGAHGHPSAEDIFKEIRKHMPTISFDTVYRTLATFEKYGLVKRVHSFDDRVRFDTVFEPHHHLVCVECQNITDFHWPNFDSMKMPSEVSHWGNIDSLNVEVRGLCRECLAKKRSQR